MQCSRGILGIQPCSSPSMFLHRDVQEVSHAAFCESYQTSTWQTLVLSAFEKLQQCTSAAFVAFPYLPFHTAQIRTSLLGALRKDDLLAL